MYTNRNIFSESGQEKRSMRFQNLISLLLFELSGLSRESVRGEDIMHV